MAESMVENELVDFICSDCHKIEQFRMMKTTKIKKHLHEMLFQYNRVKNSTLLKQ
jgi:tyrosine-protein phosphatase YwqE